jgi:hypothetical protein
MRRILDKGIHYWLPYYIWQNLVAKKKRDDGKPKHILFCVVDHFEPFQSNVDFSTARNRVNAWVTGYPNMAEKHSDADGRPPQHTWFYPPHLDHIFLKNLVGLCKSGYGDIEMHLHHNHMQPFPDTPETLRIKIRKCIDDYSRFGIFCLPDGKRSFAFIHGDWSLDNSRGDQFCGVNNELSILKECGCYADFTFPSLGAAQPSMINNIYYVKDDPYKAKSYNRGRELFVGGKPWGDLLIIPGIIGFRWKSRTHKYKPSIEVSNLDKMDYPFPSRIDYWIKNALIIKGKPDWLFIKLHTHGCREVDFDSLFGVQAENMYGYLESKFNDKNKYFLHYVTAREMYNIIKAAEAGLSGDPNKYRNFAIDKYLYI